MTVHRRGKPKYLKSKWKEAQLDNCKLKLWKKKKNFAHENGNDKELDNIKYCQGCGTQEHFITAGWVYVCAAILKI